MHKIRFTTVSRWLALLFVTVSATAAIISATAYAATVTGDLDNNGTVNAFDLNILIGNYRKTTTVGDLDGNGVVNLTDLSILLTNFGKGTPPETAKTCASTTNLALCEDFESYPNENMPAGDLPGTRYASKWNLNQACPGRVAITDDPAPGRDGKSVRMTVNSKDQRFLTAEDNVTKLKDAKGNDIRNTACMAQPNQNPRAQLVSKDLFKKGDDKYMTVGTFFPSDFPRTIGKTSYLQITELYGSPVKCGPPVGIFVVGSRIQFNQVTGIEATDSNGDCTDPKVSSGVWKAPTDIRYGAAWEKFTLRVKFSDNVIVDPKVSTKSDDGFIEIWYNGIQQKFANGTTRYYMRTLVPGINYSSGGSNQLFVNSYRGATAWPGDVTLYHDDIKVGDTYQSVQ